MRVNKVEIESYIPQRAPFIMIDNLREATNEKFETDFQILPDNIFVEEGVLSGYALIENIAQSSTVGLVISNNFHKIKHIDGFIGSISKLKVYDLPKINNTIYTIVTLLYKFENMYLLKGENYLNDKKLLECEVKLIGI